MTDAADNVWEPIQTWLSAEGLELDDIELKGSGRGRILRVVVDGEDVDLDRIAEISNGISRLLDDHADFQDPYQLEVSSPGLERTLTRTRHFEKSLGREVKVKARVDGTTTVMKGILEAADEHSISIGTDSGTVSVARSDITTAHTVFRWEKAPRPGKK